MYCDELGGQITCKIFYDTHTHTTVLLLVCNMSGSTRVSRYQKGKTKKVKTTLDLLEQEIVSGSGICGLYASLHPMQTTTTTSHHSVPSVLWCCWLGVRKGIRPVKNWVVGCKIFYENVKYSWADVLCIIGWSDVMKSVRCIQLFIALC